jgi:hypothetical protein
LLHFPVLNFRIKEEKKGPKSPKDQRRRKKAQILSVDLNIIPSATRHQLNKPSGPPSTREDFIGSRWALKIGLIALDHIKRS